MITLLDYGAGNVRSVRNAVRKLGYEIKSAETPEEVFQAEKLLFPGVGSFGLVMKQLRESGYAEPLIKRIKENKPFLGICVALQAFFDGSEESPGIEGLGILPGMVKRFPDSEWSVPQIGWNGIKLQKNVSIFDDYKDEKLYFVHSYHAPLDAVSSEWLLCTTDYGQEFVSGIWKGNVGAFQFHPEKSGQAGLSILRNFLRSEKITVKCMTGDSTPGKNGVCKENNCLSRCQKQ